MSNDAAPPPGRMPWTRADSLVLLGALVTLILFRLHAFGAPLESDECNYAYFSERLLAGDRLYVDLWDHQPPGIYGILVPVTAMLGAEPFAYRLAALVASGATLCLLGAWARRSLGREAGWTVAVLFALASSDPGIAGEGCNREIYMNLMIALAVWSLGRGPGAVNVVLAGTCVGLASLIKTVCAAHWLALAPVVLLARPTRRYRALLQFGCGPLVVWAATAAWFAATGRWAQFVDAVFVYNIGYAAVDGPWIARLWSVDSLQPFVSAAPVWLAAGCAGVGLLVRAVPQRGTLIGLAVGSYVAACLPGRFWPHYFLLGLPAAVLLVAAAIHAVGRVRRAGAWAVLGLVAGALACTQAAFYLRIAPDDLGRQRYGPRMAWVRDQAARIAAVTAPDDSIYVWSTDVGFYYYSGRRCATRFTMNEPLMVPGPATLRRRAQLARDLAADAPRLILIIARPDGRHPCPELLQFIQEHRYVTAGLDRPHGLEVLCAMARPIETIDWRWPPAPPTR